MILQHCRFRIFTRYQVIELLKMDGTVFSNASPLFFRVFLSTELLERKCVNLIISLVCSQIYMKVMKFSLDAADCEDNFVEIIGKDLISDRREARICDASTAPIIVSGNVAHLILYSQPLSIDSNFIIKWKAIDKPSKSSKYSLPS